MGFLLKLIIICLIVYWVVRWAASFLLPLYLAAKRVQQKNTQSMEKPAQNNMQTLQYKGGDYIEYEEVE
ncbi:hypothetical protein C7N43_13480 [Sphingobacteriales bacterium UPWRP_1]|nr:hypothetical protein BVG80_11450 [Sphingobacteriales bacterium TSM_CSM]PSJ76459.1 hypothetical protein C7N43_13480 [Sphingobacteriales bacterium UPWRP_1]